MTIEKHIDRYLPADMWLRPRRRNTPARYFLRPKYQFSEDEFHGGKISSLLGHHLGESLVDLFPSRTINRVVLIRDPQSFLLSYYNFRMWRYEESGWPQLSFDTWYATRPRNPISTFLLQRYFGIPLSKILSMPLADRFEYLNAHLADFW